MRSPNADLMLGQRRKRWANIKSAEGQQLISVWIYLNIGSLGAVT